jgi:hypothetical protein
MVFVKNEKGIIQSTAKAMFGKLPFQSNYQYPYFKFLPLGINHFYGP